MDGKIRFLKEEGGMSHYHGPSPIAYALMQWWDDLVMNELINELQLLKKMLDKQFTND